MKKTYMKLFALATMLVMSMTASAQYTTEIEDGMFKAWDSPDPGATEVPAEEAGAEDADFGLVNTMYENVQAGATVWGHFNVYYLWYADLTGTQTITFSGTPGMQLRVLMNRPAPEEGGDAHGGAQVERTGTIGDDGTLVVDVSDLAYVHLNAVKLGWGSPAGKIRGITLFGSVQGSGETHQPIEALSAGYQNDVVCINLGNLTNMKELNATSERVLFPNDCVSVTVNGVPATIMSVEGMEGNKLFIFLDEGYPEGEEDEVLVTFTNPREPHLYFTDGRFEGEDVPSFTDMKAAFQDGLAEYFSYLAAIPELVSAVPEDGSFNLPTSTNTFVLTFSANVNCETVKAMFPTLPNGAITVTPSSGYSKELTLTYNGGEIRGVHELLVTGLEPEINYLEQSGEVTLTYSFGPVDLEGDVPSDIITTAAFDDCQSGYIPEGFIVNFNGEERAGGSSYGSGPRMFVFADGGDFTHGLYFREGYCEADAIKLEAGKNYTIRFLTAQWKDNGKEMKFEILDENESAVLSQDITNEPNMNGDTSKPVTGASVYSIKFTPEADGNYRLRWTADGFHEVLLAKVSVKYVPNVLGVEWLTLVQDAITSAQSTLDGNSDERYSGAATAALSDLIAKYSDLTQFTNPSGCQAAADELNAAAQAVKDHRAACDEYDAIIKKALDVVRQNAGSKFESTELYAQLVSTVQKFNGSSEWQNTGTEEEPAWTLVYTYDVLTGDDELSAAVADLTAIANTTSLLFTEGASNPEGANTPEISGTTHFFGLDSNGRQQSKGTGVAVLTERLRLGAEALMRLGATVDNPAINAYLSAMTDDDAVAAKLKNAIWKEVDAQKDTYFAEKEDPATMETYTETVDMTVYVVNPNVYKQQANMNVTPENVPGWTTPEGYSKPGLTVGWNHVGETEELAVDCMFSTWGGSYRVEQTITDLPKGVYTIKAGFQDRNNGTTEEAIADTYLYAQTTGAEPLTAQCPIVGQSFPFAFNGVAIEGVEVTDGRLTIGVNAASGTYTFFNDVRLYMTAYNDKFVDGDVNGDGTVDVADISNIITIMADGSNNRAGDVNGDGTVDVADISNVITIMAESARKAGVAIGDKE